MQQIKGMLGGTHKELMYVSRIAFFFRLQMRHSTLAYFLLRSFYLNNLIENDNDMNNSKKCLACIMNLVINKM